MQMRQLRQAFQPATIRPQVSDVIVENPAREQEKSCRIEQL
jgi:hypothetical protein